MGNVISKFRNFKNLRWERLLLPVLGFFLCFLVFETATSMENPGFCNLCHAMKPYYSSWGKSTHSKIQCYSCHSAYAGPNARTKTERKRLPTFLFTSNKVIIIFGKSVDYLAEKIKEYSYNFNNELELFRMYYNMAGGRSNRPKENDVWNSCFKCHNSLISTEEKDNLGHFKHLKAGLQCTQCHNDLVHGQQQIVVSQQTCAKCHGKELPRPVSHDSLTFNTTHGRDYKKTKSCLLCHSEGVRQKLCMDCHKVEVPHPVDYKVRHIPEIARIGVRNCMNCHENKSDAGLNSSLTCEACHGKKMPHAKDILQTHTTLVKKQGINTCSYCHQTTAGQKDMALACIDCHKIVIPHPPNFKWQHKPAALAGGLAICAFCHSQANPVNGGAPWANPGFCYNCHMQNKPHGPGFINQHQQENNDPLRCFLCHPGANHCIGCHPGEA